jgi:hypothetical protein
VISVDEASYVSCDTRRGWSKLEYDSQASAKRRVVSLLLAIDGTGIGCIRDQEGASTIHSRRSSRNIYQLEGRYY